MKHNFKKILSMFLTVCMLLGTVSAIIPFTVSAAEYQTITVNGEEKQLPYTLENNKDQVINGVTYRFDTGSANGSYAKILANGTVELYMVQGDLFWIPSLEIQQTSETWLTVELTATPQTGNVSAGLAYGIEEWNSSDDQIMVAGFASNNRTRVGYTSVANSQKADAGLQDHYCANNNTSGKKADWSNTTWSVGETRKIRMYYSDGADEPYAFDYCTDGGTVKTVRSYANSKINNGLGNFDGALGFLMIYSDGSAYDSMHHMFTLKNIEVTNLVSGGDANGEFDLTKALASQTTTVGNPDTYITVNGKIKSLPYTLENNTDQVINGVTYRFDTGAETESYAKILEDGSIELYMVQGDLFWIPSLEIQQSSTVYMTTELTASPQIANICAGLAYGITEWNSADDMLVAAAMGSAKRTRVSVYSIATSRKNDGSSTGTDYCGYNSNNQNFTNSEWQNGEIRNIKLYYSESGDPYRFDFCENGSVKRTRTFDSSDELAQFKNSVGFFMGYSGNHDSGVYYEQYHKFTMKNIEATNLASGGTDGSFNMKSSIKNGFATEGAVSDVVASLSLNGTIGFNFKFLASSYAETHGKLVVTKNGEEILNESFVNLWDSEERACVYSVPVAAKEMNDTVTFTIYIDDVVYGGHTYTTSVKKYAKAMLENNDYAEWHELLAAMLNYGAAAQMALGYKTNDLAADISGGITFDFSGYEAIIYDGDTDILDGLYMNLVLESDTAFNIYFKPATGVELTVTVNGDAAELTDNGDGYYVASIEGIAAHKLAEDVLVVVNGSLTFKVNALDWAKIASADADPDVATLAKALAVYANEATSKN